MLAGGRGLTYGAALELAPNFEETNLRPVRGLLSADLRHGPIAVLDEMVAVVLVSAVDGPLLDDSTHLARDARATGAATIGLDGTAAFRSACGTRLGRFICPSRSHGSCSRCRDSSSWGASRATVGLIPMSRGGCPR